MRRATGLFAIAIVLAIAGGGLTAGPATGATGQHPAPRAMAAYEWNQAGSLSTTEVRRRLGFLRANGFRTVYLEIGNYLEAADRPLHARGRWRKLEKIRLQIRRFVATASSFGLAVHAVGGGPDWTGTGSYLGRKLVRLVGDYNKRAGAGERLRGVQLDIEPYVLDGWWDDPSASLMEYLATIKSIVDTYRPLRYSYPNRDLQLGFAIPFWLDEHHDPPGEVWFRGSRQAAAYHIIDLLRYLPGTYLVIMSYRNFTDGENGSIWHASDEFRYADSVNCRCGLLVGQQYSPVERPDVPDEEEEPETTTFDGLPRSAFLRAAAEITAAFSGYRQFRGLTLDSIDDYRAAPLT